MSVTGSWSEVTSPSNFGMGWEFLSKDVREWSTHDVEAAVVSLSDEEYWDYFDARVAATKVDALAATYEAA